ncbi:MAG: signal peptide peptidase SppA [Chitinivibrionales bacterium]
MGKTQKAVIIGIILLPVFLGMFYRYLGETQKSVSVMPGTSRIGYLEINDVIYSSSYIVKALSGFAKTKNLSGVLIRVNSPGGAVAPCQEIYSKIEKLKDKGIKIVVSMGNVAASGGYYVSVPADRIFANQGTLTGSIGVIIQYPQYNEMLNKIGVKVKTIKAGNLKDVGNPSREMNPGEEVFMQNLIDDTHSKFIEDVAEYRSLSDSQLTLISDARVLTGRQAINSGLVDTLGSLSEAEDYIKKTCNVPSGAKMITPDKKDFKNLFSDFTGSVISDIFGIRVNNSRKYGCFFLTDGF